MQQCAGGVHFRAMNTATRPDRVVDGVVDGATDDLLIKREVAAKLRRSVRTIDAWMREGKLPYFKVGRTVRFRWSDVLKKLSDYRIN
jgi:excisionase family DNA binding protein